MAQGLKVQKGGLLSRSEIAKKINIAVTTVKRWMTALERFYYVPVEA